MDKLTWSTHGKPLTTTILTELRLHHVLLFLMATVLSKIAYNVLLHPLGRLPGPFAAGATELWRTRKYALGKGHDDILELHEKYGPVVRIAPNEVSFVDKDALIRVYGHSTGTRKTSWYNVWDINNDPMAQGVFNTTDPKVHSFLRKRLANVYSMSTLLTLESKMQEVADVIWTRLRAVAKQGDVVDVQDEASNFAFDVVSKLGLGERFGFVDHSAVGSGDIIPSIHGFFYISAILGYIPGQIWWVQNFISQSLLKAFAPPWMTGAASFSAWTNKQVLKRMAEETKSSDHEPDMLDHFIAMKDPEGKPVAPAAVSVEVGNLIGAGADTTAIGIAVVLGQLALHPEDYRRVQQEIDAAYAEHDTDKSWSLDYRTASKLPWFEACIKESTRMCPSILWQPPYTPEEGIEIAGHYIPASATLSMSPIAHNRCRDIWGDDADQFRPGRWVVGEEGASEVYVREIEKYNTTFGYGSRTCIGKHLALIEIHKFVGQFVRHFDCELVNKDVPYVRRSQWFCLQENLLVKLRERTLTAES